MRLLTAASLATLALLTPAFAAEDEATGLGVNLSDEFIVEATPPMAQYTANFGVKSASGTPANFEGEAYLCQVSFAPAPQNADLSQEEINAMLTSPEWLDLAKQSMEPVFTFEEDSGFELAGFNGHEFIAVPKQEGAEDVRLVLSMLETSKGRTAISCVAHADTLAETLDTFRAIRDGVTPPT